MDAFDIIWLVVCIGLPVLSGLLSSGKKKSGKSASVPQPEGKRGLADILKDIAAEISENVAEDDEEVSSPDDAEVGDECRVPDVVEKRGYEVMQPVPVSTVIPGKTADIRLASTYVVKRPSVTATVKESIVPDVKAGVGTVSVDEPRKRAEKERIDPEKLVVYTAIMNPKFKEY